MRSVATISLARVGLPWSADWLLIAVAMIWRIPDRRIEKTLDSHRVKQNQNCYCFESGLRTSSKR